MQYTVLIAPWTIHLMTEVETSAETLWFYNTWTVDQVQEYGLTQFYFVPYLSSMASTLRFRCTRLCGVYTWSGV